MAGNIASDPHETTNLAEDPEYAEVLKKYQQRMKDFQKRMHDPWILKWTYE